jgi:hypothetical protein
MADEQTISRVFNGVMLTGAYTLQGDIVTSGPRSATNRLNYSGLI